MSNIIYSCLNLVKEIIFTLLKHIFLAYLENTWLLLNINNKYRATLISVFQV